MGVTGLWASVLGIIQNPGDDSRFSVSYYFLILFFTLLGSAVGLSFVIVPYLRRLVPDFKKIETPLDTLIVLEIPEQVSDDQQPLLMPASDETSELDELDVFESRKEQSPQTPISMALSNGLDLILNQFWATALNSFLKGVFVFSIYYYSNAPTLILWSNVLGMTADSIARLITAW
eukprot:CAMPEP_0201555804 /NCGR_PEP_ID=MMETSP0173_2-20130828/51438_1 /ASSEMBLY_ACC=CAM_ASM_000268 /TAXON_ID=218659 /ORGANISM="Vexillifera sp., Strain DIVA3 564/2" /LENGTH=175 /DNA_ID=CAMNT_0047967775 /DNA_START=409 /DNA_END=933 /DNA_ORIENTATION=-